MILMILSLLVDDLWAYSVRASINWRFGSLEQWQASYREPVTAEIESFPATSSD